MKKENGKIATIIIFVIIIIMAIVIGIIIKNKKGNIDYSNYTQTNTGNEPVVSYFDKQEGVGQEIENNQIITKKVEISYNKGSAKISKDGEKYTDYNGETLADGKYIMVVIGDDETITKKEFEVDTMPPAIIGVEQAKYNTEREIKFENPEDVKIATLVKDEQEIDLKAHITKKEDSYKVTEDGIYKIYVEDHNGNSTTFKFTIKK